MEMILNSPLDVIQFFHQRKNNTAEKKSQPAPNIKDGHSMADSDIKVTDLVDGVKRHENYCFGR